VCNLVTFYNIDDLFLMNTDGTEPTLLTRGGSATWSPDSKSIAFHASASYYASGGLVTGCPIRTDPGSATSDSDIFVVNVDDLLAGVEEPRNITNSPAMIDDDPDWSSDGQKIVFTSHPVTDDRQRSNQAELYLMNPDGTDVQPLTDNDEEERAPAWSFDGSRIVFMCRIGGGTADFEICVINAALNPDGTLPVATQLTDNAVFDGTPTFSPDGDQILFHRNVGVAGSGSQQLFIMNARLNADGKPPTATQLTFGSPTSGDGVNTLAHWGELRLMGPNAAP
jgi:TolB protein